MNISMLILACLATVLAACHAHPATLDDALREFPALEESKAMAVSVSAAPVAVNAGGQASDLAAMSAALGGCERVRLQRGSDRPCEIFRLNEATASTAADIKAGTDAPHPLFMWRYQSGATRVHLVGSIHVLKGALHPLPEQIETAFAEADHVAVEVDIVNADAEAIARAFAKFALLPDGTGIEESLNDAQREQLLDELRKLGIGLADVSSLKPLFFATQLTMARLAAFGYLPNYGIEFHFLSRLEARSVYELETVEQQLALLAGVPMEDQVEMLVDTLDDMAEVEPMMAEMTRAWFLGDDDQLLRLFERYTAGSEANRTMLEALVYQRNLTLAASIKQLLDKPGVWFVLVGAGHMPGPRGIVALLEAQGVKGQRVMSTNIEQP